MLKERKVRRETQFLLHYQKRYVDLSISNNSSNIFLSAVVLPDFTKNTVRKKLFEELLMTFLMTSFRQKQGNNGTSTRNKNRRHSIYIY
jgi:hypothetical protein